MITKKQLKIFQVFAKQPFAEFTLKQIKQLAKEKSNNALSLAIKQFSKEQLIKQRKIGKSSLIALNFNNESIYYYIALANLERIDKITQQSLNLIKEEIEKITLFYSLAIFGSYASDENKKNSDLDIAIFIENKNKIKKFEVGINSAAQKSLLPLDVHIITKDEFLEMLINDEENLGKQIARKHLAIANNQIFYKMIEKGRKHGFKI